MSVALLLEAATRWQIDYLVMVVVISAFVVCAFLEGLFKTLGEIKKLLEKRQ